MYPRDCGSLDGLNCDFTVVCLLEIISCNANTALTVLLSQQGILFMFSTRSYPGNVVPTVTEYLISDLI